MDTMAHCLIEMEPERTAENIPDETWERLRRSLQFYFSRRGCSDHEELAQDTVDRVWTWLAKGNTLHGANALEKFAFGVARRVRLEHLKDRFKSTTELSDAFAAPENRTHGLNSFELSAELDWAMAQLTPAERDILVDDQRLTRDQMAEEYGEAKNTIAVWVHRAKEKLRGLLNDSRGSK